MAIRKPLFVVPLNLGTFDSGNARPGNPVFSLNRFKALGVTWRSTGNANLWARGIFTAAQAIDFAAMISANAQSGTTIRLRLGTSQAEVDGTASYDSGALTYISPAITREDGLYHWQFELPSVQTFAWWRIDIGGHTGDFEASMLVLGKKFEPSHFYNFDFERGVEDLGEVAFTRFGVMDETPGTVMRSLNFTLAWQSEAEFEGSFRPMIEKLGKRGIVYVCFDAEATTYRQSKTYMGVMRKPPFARGIRKPKTFTQDYEILSMI